MYLLDAVTAYEYSIAKRNDPLNFGILGAIVKCITDSISNGDLNTIYEDNLEYKSDQGAKNFITSHKEQQQLLENIGYDVILEHHSQGYDDFHYVYITMNISWYIDE